MSFASSKLTAQGQISVRAEVRRKLGLAPGSVLKWEEDGERVVARARWLLESSLFPAATAAQWRYVGRARRCGQLAQWLGQFTGRTHGTAVRDAEELLRHAVAQLRLASPDHRARKAKAVRALAKRVYSARVRFLKASIQAVSEPNVASVHDDHGRDFDRLQSALSRVEAASLDGVLEEFSALDVQP